MNPLVEVSPNLGRHDRPFIKVTLRPKADKTDKKPVYAEAYPDVGYYSIHLFTMIEHAALLAQIEQLRAAFLEGQAVQYLNRKDGTQLIPPADAYRLRVFYTYQDNSFSGFKMQETDIPELTAEYVQSFLTYPQELTGIQFSFGLGDFTIRDKGKLPPRVTDMSLLSPVKSVEVFQHFLEAVTAMNPLEVALFLTTLAKVFEEYAPERKK